jgi:DNA-binding CsgD family transcriptional regulator/PAS domain-containing protein
MTVSDDQFHALVGRIYDCVLEPDLWDETLLTLAHALQFATCSVEIRDFETGTFRAAKLLGVTPQERVKPLETEAADMEEQGKLALVEFLTWPLDEPWVFQRNRYFERFGHLPGIKAIRDFGIIDGITFLVMRDRQRFGNVTMGRKNEFGFVSDSEAAVFKRFMPHLRRALIISDVLDSARVELEASRKAIDALAAGVMIVARDGRVIEANTAARAFLSEGEFIASRGGRIEAANRDAQKRLLAAIALADSKADESGAGVALPGIRDHGVAHVMPLGATEARMRLASDAAALIFIKARSSRTAAPLDALSALYGLTRAEANLLGEIAAGKTPEETAATLGIAVSTARTHLTRLFQKTGTARQADLIALVARLTPPV